MALVEWSAKEVTSPQSQEEVRRWLWIRPHEEQALRRLIDVASRPTGQGERIADFLLAWWNKDECGGFDLAQAWAFDDDLGNDLCTVFVMIVRYRKYPDTLG